MPSRIPVLEIGRELQLEKSFLKFSELSFQPRLLRLPHAEQYVGGEANLKRLREVGWIKPLVAHKSNTTFDRNDLDAAVDRAKLEGWPTG